MSSRPVYSNDWAAQSVQRGASRAFPNKLVKTADPRKYSLPNCGPKDALALNKALQGRYQQLRKE